MLALVVEKHGSIDALTLKTLPEPIAARGEVLLDVRAASVNFPDLMVIAGTYQNLPALPFVPGKDMAGVVAAVGEGVTRVKVGDRVMATIEHGAFAQRCVVSERFCQQMPQSMRFAQGAAIGLVYVTAYFALVERAGLRPGEKVLVTGAAGGVGLAAVQVAKALGATVVAAVSSTGKATMALQNGADHVVRTDVANLRDALRAQVFAAVGPGGVDIVIDQVGGDVFDASLRTLAWCGRLVIVGFAEGRVPEVKAGLLLVKNISLIGLQVSDYRERAVAKVNEAQAHLCAMFGEGSLKPQIMAEVPLHEFPRAFAAVRDRQVLGKVVLDMGAPGAS